MYFSNDKLMIPCNFKTRFKTVAFGQVNHSGLVGVGPPKENGNVLTNIAVFFWIFSLSLLRSTASVAFDFTSTHPPGMPAQGFRPTNRL